MNVVNDQSVLVSIIIPSKNRHAQLFETLKANAAVGQLRDVEMVIADNSAKRMPSDMEAACRALYSNFVYQNDPAEKSIIANFNDGLRLATGRFIMFIGDDDFVLPEVVKAAQFALEQQLQCVIYPPDKYYWGSCQFAERSVIGPNCLIRGKGGVARAVDARAELLKSAKNGFLTIESLPRAYHGLVERSKMMSMAGADGQPITGGSPDISMAVSLALHGTRTYFWANPLSIYGASTGSGGGMTTSGTHLLPLDKATFLDQKFVSTWHSSIPAYWSEYTVFPASALYMHGQMKVAPDGFKLAAVYAAILINERHMARQLRATFASLDAALRSVVLRQLPAVLVRKSAGRVWRKLVNAKLVKAPSIGDISHGVGHLDVLDNYRA